MKEKDQIILVQNKRKATNKVPGKITMKIY